jgi:RNA polymerase sigma factor (sigma-70 family)
MRTIALARNSPSRTSATLLGRLRHDVADQEAWAEFVHRYGPLIYHWCRHWRLQEADAQDVAQIVLAKLAAKLGTFQYDPNQSFRAYVKTLARYAWCDVLASRQDPGAGGSGDSVVLKLLDTVEAREDLESRLAEAFDRELLDEAMARVRLRVEPRTWEAFRLTTLEGLSGAEASGRSGMEVAAVYKAKSKVQRMLKDETRRIQETW